MSVGSESLDDLTTLLLRVADDLVNLVIDSDAIRMYSGLPALHGVAAFEAHPLQSAILRQAQADPDLRRLFPNSGDPSGRAWLYPPNQLAFQLVNGAAWHTIMSGSTAASAFRARLVGAVQQLRLTCKTGREQATVYVGLTFELPAGTELSVPWGGVLRADRQADRILYAHAADENAVPAKRCLLEAGVELPVGVSASEDFVEEQVPALDGMRTKLITLAALLTLGPENHRPTLPWLETRVSKVAPGPTGSGSRRPAIEGPSLPKESLKELQQWLSDLALHPPPKIALDRSLSIMASHSDYISRFIDAVIAWENLFGSGDAQEVSYRVSMNMAAVMSDVVEERILLQRELNRLYSRRSRIIHGGYHPTPVEAHDLWRRARSHTFRAVARLVRQHPDLIAADAKDYIAFLLGQRP